MTDSRVDQILDKVKDILHRREGNYDDPALNFARIAAYWTIRLRAKLRPGEAITANDVADMAILMKVAREQFKHGDDNYLDIIGYAVCGQRLADVAPLMNQETVR